MAALSRDKRCLALLLAYGFSGFIEVRCKNCCMTAHRILTCTADATIGRSNNIGTSLSRVQLRSARTVQPIDQWQLQGASGFSTPVALATSMMVGLGFSKREAAT